MSRWYDQHRITRRIRRLEREFTIVTYARGYLQGRAESEQDGISLGYEKARRDMMSADRDAHDAREGSPAFQPADALAVRHGEHA